MSVRPLSFALLSTRSRFILRSPGALFLLLALQLLPGAAAFALQLQPIFSDGMVLQRDKPIVVRGTAAPGARVTVELFSGKDGPGPGLATAGAEADAGGRWQASLPARAANSSPLTLRVNSDGVEKSVRDVVVGDVWICSGQSNMNFLMRPNPPWSEGVLDWEDEVRMAQDGDLRIFTVVPEAAHIAQEEAQGLWRKTTPVYAGYFAAVPYYFGKSLRDALGIPIGVIVAALGATSIKEWSDPADLVGRPDTQNVTSRHAKLRESNAAAVDAYYSSAASVYRKAAMARMAEPNYAAAYTEPYKGWRSQPGGLFNAMIRPLDWFPVKGFVWYQGETDTTQNKLYRDHLKRLIEGQRARRGDAEMPFIVVQLTNHDPVARGNDPAVFTGVWADLREAQEEAASLPGTALVVTADVGNATIIHPRDKKTVGWRCARAALSLCYGSSLSASGPVLDSWEVVGNEVRLHFTRSNGGLVLDRTRATGSGPDFEIAGSDGAYHPADAQVAGQDVVLSSPKVTMPVFVRYAFHNDPKLVLYDAEGLPARPFRRQISESEQH
jgi:sialate O-acetylesterase